MSTLTTRRKRRKKWVERPNLGDDIPRARRTISETGPSIPSDEEHATVRWIEKDFGLLNERSFENIKNYPMGLIATNGAVEYGTENDVAGHVKTLVTHVLIALDADDAAVYSEIATFNLRPDLWVVIHGGLPIGVIEVKKPDIDNGVKGMENANVLGELFDFMEHLPNFYGITPAFGIVTNLVQWRVAWLPGSGVDEMAAAEEDWVVYEENGDYGEEDRCDDDDKDGKQADNEDDDDDVSGSTYTPNEEEATKTGESPLRATASKRNPIIHEVQITDDYEASEEDDDDPGVEEDYNLDRFFHISRIFDKSDAVRAIASAIAKMYRVRKRPFDYPFDRLSERTILKFEKAEAMSIFWVRLTNVTPKWDKIARPKKYLYAIEDLGRGAHGRVWLTCSSSGAVCVLKFALNDKPDGLDEEFKFWKRIYPSFPVFRETWCGHPALRMPHFAQVRTEDRPSKVELVKAALEQDFVTHGLVHHDVYWRNIGIYTDKRGDEKAVVFDMGAVRAFEESDTGWVETACQRLLR